MVDAMVPPEQLERAAQRFKILSEPVRLELLNQLQTTDEMTVSELVEATGHRQANVSKHLGLMAREGLLDRRKDGLYVFYRISDPTLSALCMLVCGRLREEAQQAAEAATA
jgi:ArsR family transcriptional regulator